MTGALEPHRGGQIEPVTDGPTWLTTLAGAAELARQIADTDFVPDAYRRKPAQIAACVLYGDELGVGPMAALAKIAIINGRPAPSAELGRALAIAAGHRIWIDRATTTTVTACGQRRGDEHVHTVTWTMDDAKRAGIAGGAQWRKYPRQMLTARATSELIRTMAPDILGGVAIFAEEAADGDLDADTAAPTPPAAEETTTRKRPAKKAATKKATARKATAKKATAKKATAKKATGGGPPRPPDDDLLDDDDQGDDDDRDDDTRAPLASDAQRRALFATFNGADLTDRDDRLAFTRGVLGRNIATSNDLTRDDADQLFAALKDLAAGRLEIHVDDTGDWTVTATDDGEADQ